MAEKIIVAATLQVDTGDSNTEIKEVNKNAGDLKKTLGETGTAAAKTGKEVETSSGSFGKLKGQMEGLPGPLGQASQGVGKLQTAFKALLANPIVLFIAAIVAGLALLYKAFTSTNDGADKMEQVFSGLGAAINVIRDRILKAASAIGKFFSGDFKGALADARSAVSGIGAEIASEFAAAANATRIIQELDDELRNLSVSRAKLNADLAEAKEKINDTDLSAAERRANIAKVREAESKQNAAELAEAEARYNAIKAKNDLSDKRDEDLQNEADALIKLENLRAQSASQNRQLDKLDKQITREQNAAAAERARTLAEQYKAEQALQKEKAEKEKADLLAKLGATHQYYQALTEMQNKQAEEDKMRSEEWQKTLDDQFNKEQALANASLENDRKNSAAKIEIAKKEKEAKQTLVSEIANGLNTLSEVAGKQTAIGKALAIASTTIATYQSAIGAFKGMVTTIPGPVGIALGAVAAAGALATGISAVKKIIAVKVPGGSGGGSSPSLSTPSTPAAPVAPTQTSTSLDAASIAKVGNAAAPVAAYVVEAQGVSATETRERLNRAARLGG